MNFKSIAQLIKVISSCCYEALINIKIVECFQSAHLQYKLSVALYNNSAKRKIKKKTIIIINEVRLRLNE